MKIPYIPSTMCKQKSMILMSFVKLSSFWIKQQDLMAGKKNIFKLKWSKSRMSKKYCRCIIFPLFCIFTQLASFQTNFHCFISATHQRKTSQINLWSEVWTQGVTQGGQNPTPWGGGGGSFTPPLIGHPPYKIPSKRPRNFWAIWRSESFFPKKKIYPLSKWHPPL